MSSTRRATPSRLLTHALWGVVVLLSLVGVAGAIGRGVFPGDLATRAEPLRLRILGALDRTDASALDRPRELRRFDRRFADNRRMTLLHIIPGGLFLLLAPFQFSSRIRNRNIRLHRWSGRGLVAAGTIAGVTGLFFGVFMPFGGAAEAIPIALVSTLLLVALIRAVVAIRRGEVRRHREWMLRAFAVVFSIATVRLVGAALDVMLAPTGLPPDKLFVRSIWAGWALTLGAAECWIRYTRLHLAIAQPLVRTAL